MRKSKNSLHKNIKTRKSKNNLPKNNNILISRNNKDGKATRSKNGRIRGGNPNLIHV